MRQCEKCNAAVCEGLADDKAVVDGDSLLWKQYIVYVDLFKMYVDILFKASAAFFTLTGGVVTYVYANTSAASPNQRLFAALLLPIVLSVGLARICGKSAVKAEEMDACLQCIRKRLKLPGAPHVTFLVDALRGGEFLLYCIALALCVLFLFPDIVVMRPK